MPDPLAGHMFGFYRFGTNFSVNPPQQVASVGAIKFGLHGDFQTAQQTSKSGTFNPPIPLNTDFFKDVLNVNAGTYVFDNGFVTLYANPVQTIAQGVVVGNGDGDEIYMLAQTPQNCVIVIGKKVPDTIHFP